MNELFIEPELTTDAKNPQNASYVRKTFQIQKEIKNAAVKFSACGMYKAFVNGAEVDTQVFLPGRTSYGYRLQYQEYDVTKMLRAGENAIVTDRSWKAFQNGPVRRNNVKQGELYDARKELQGWTDIGFDDSRWHGVKKSSYPGQLVPGEGERITEHERFQPEKILHTPDGSTVLDFGQNLAGYVEFRVKGKAGTKVELVCGETLDENGNFTLENLGFRKDKHTGCYPQTIQYILTEGTQRYKPLF